MIHMSLFSGIGGFDLASDWMGWKNYVSCEINDFGNKVLEYYWPNAYHHKDIHTLTYETIDKELTKRHGAEWRNDDVILTGGFPCQPYSQAGKRLGQEDDRHLWPEMLRAIREIAPTYVVGENVNGLVNWNGGLVFDEVQADLEVEGYEVQPVILPAASVNAPHRRDRIWFVAYNNNRDRTKVGLQTGGEEHVDGSKRTWITPDTRLQRQEKRQEPTMGAEQLRQQQFAPDTKGEQGKRMRPEQREFSESEQGEFRGNSSEMGNGNVAFPQRIGSSRKEYRQEKPRFNTQEDSGCGWTNFPTQPPVRSIYDGVPSTMVRNIKQEIYGQISERYTDKDLQEVWQIFQSEKVREQIGRLYKIYEPRVLLQTVQLCSPSNTNQKGASVFSEKTSEGILRKMRSHGKLTDIPQGRELEKQFKKQFGDSLPYLSHEIALVTMEAERASKKYLSWHRNESIKAYGNAVVPQVVFEIFKAINKT